MVIPKKYAISNSEKKINKKIPVNDMLPNYQRKSIDLVPFISKILPFKQSFYCRNDIFVPFPLNVSHLLEIKKDFLKIVQIKFHF